MSLPSMLSLGSVAVVGGFGNILTLVTMLKDTELIERYSTLLRSTMLIAALFDALFCVVGLPLRIYNLALGERSAQVLSALFCLLLEWFTWRLIKVSLWILGALALTRFVAVYAPAAYRRWSKLGVVTWGSILLALLASNGLFAVATFSGWVRIEPLQERGDCFPIIDSNLAAWFGMDFFFVDSVSTFFVPVPLTLALYALTWLRVFLRRRAAQRQVFVASMGNQDSVAGAQRWVQGDPEADKRLRLMTMLFVANLALICPNQVVFYAELKPTLIGTVPLLVDIFDFLYFASIAVNPIVYTAVSKDLRDAFKRTLGMAQ